MMPRSTAPFVVCADDRKQLERWLAASNTPQAVVMRCRIIQASARGETEASSAAALDMNRKTVRLWKARVLANGLPSVRTIAAGRGRLGKFTAEQVQAVIGATLQTQPKGATQWSCRTMAEAQGMSKSTVSTQWRSHNLVAQSQPEAAPDQNMQAVAGSKVPRTADRRCESVPESSRQGNRAL